jgi:alpha-galactosidase
MLEVGNGGMTPTEYRTHFSLWAIMAAPMLIGSDLRDVSEDTFTILKNTDVIAVDQDRLGRQATVVSSANGLVVYARTLANGDRAVALSNETTTAATISTTAAAIGLTGSPSYTLKDLWTKATRTTTGTISASVPGHATVLYRVSRPGTTTRYEAESGIVGQGAVESNHSGFSGRGFVNYNNVTGSSVEWTVNAAQAGPATLIFDYANGTTTNRPMNITVNGATVNANLAFPGSGAWSLWRNSTITVNLNAGNNVIRTAATTASGGPNLDYLDVHVNGAAPPPATEYQAENATVANGLVESQHAGFTGSGYVNYNNVVDSAVEFTVNVATAGQKSVTFRFANGTTTNRPMDIVVNGQTQGPGVAFNGTGAWTSWADTSVTLNLNAGNNTIRATATTANGGPNLDRITIS